MPIVEAAAAVVQTLTGVATAIAQIKDANKRREMEMAIARMSAADQVKLNEKILRSSNKNAQLQMLIEATTRTAESNKKLVYWVIGGSLLFLLLAVYISKK